MVTSYVRPSYSLLSIQKAFRSVSDLRMTLSARQHAFRLGLDDFEIIHVIQAISTTDFYKSMPSKKWPRSEYQDVYKVHWNGLYLYIKFQRIHGYVVVSFKTV